MAAGCGPISTRFSVEIDASAPSTAQPTAGKALVYVFEDEFPQRGGVTTRVGLDGTWVGANHGNSYLKFEVAPGSHRICSDWQSRLGRLQKKIAASDLNAEAGKTYYFRTLVLGDRVEYLGLEPVSAAESTLLLSESGASISKAKQ